MVETEFCQRGRQSLIELTTLHDHHSELRVELTHWPTHLLEALGRVLLEAFPICPDPDRENRVVQITAATELADVRDRAISLLIRQDNQEARDALERLAARDSGLSEWLKAHRARRQAETVLSNLPDLPPDSATGISVSDAVRILDQADYHLIRSSDDLLEAVCDVLRQVGQDVAEDLALLYSKPPRQQASKGGASAREHLEEDSLQAYIRRRLSDLLPRVVRDVEVLPVREDQIRFRRRLDVRVVAPCLNRRDLATVVIEIKWSDNTETETSLVDQLGHKYLLGERLTRGIYLVGWCGHWHRSGAGRQTDRSVLEEFLVNQSNQFCASEESTGLRIESVVLPLEWRDQ